RVGAVVECPDRHSAQPVAFVERGSGSDGHDGGEFPAIFGGEYPGLAAAGGESGENDAILVDGEFALCGCEAREGDALVLRAFPASGGLWEDNNERPIVRALSDHRAKSRAEGSVRI